MSNLPPGGLFSFDFFVSRRGSAKDKALEVVHVLEQAGFKVRVQDKDIKSGDDFYQKMDEFARECRDCIAILTKDYFTDGWAKQEWSAFKAIQFESGGQRRLIPLRVDDFRPGGINTTTVYVDLVGLTKAKRRKAILDEIDRVPPSVSRVPAPSQVPASKPPHGVPKQNPGFVGRGKLLQQLHQTLTRKKVARVAIHGLGGVGKSSLVAEYAHRYRGDYAGVWWAQAETRTVLVESLAALDDILDANGADISSANANGAATSPVKKNPEERAKSALSKLTASERPWLLIFDNAEKPKEVSEFFPAAGARVLITTRRTNWHQLATTVRLNTLDELEACRLLLATSGLKDNRGAIRLAKALGHLPLALYHAGAYVKDAGLTFGDYIARLDKLIGKGADEDDDSASVAATFTLAIERATDKFPDALKLLSFLSMLGADHIPRDLIDDSIVAADALDDAMKALASVSLIQYEELDDGSRGINVHRLVQAAMRGRLGLAGTAEALKIAIARLSRAFPDSPFRDLKTWPRCKQLIPHAEALRDNARNARVENEELALLLNSAGNYLLACSAFARAESVFKDSIAIVERAWGPESIRVGKWVYELGNLFLNSAKYELAKEKYKRANEIAVRELGRSDPWLARPLANLGYAEMRLGEFELAEGYIGEALMVLGEPEGTKDYWVATTLHKLGYVYWETKRYRQAELTICDAIAMGKEVLKPDAERYERIYDWQADLAGVLRDVGRLDEAERLYRDAIEGLDRLKSIAHDEHPATSFARRGYAQLLLKAGRPQEARDEASLALKAQEALFGPEHLFTRETIAVLEQVLVALGERTAPHVLAERAPSRVPGARARAAKAG